MRTPLPRTPLLAFFVLAFALTWGTEGVIALVRPSSPAVTAGLYELAGAGPSIAAVVVVAVTGGRAGLRELVRRMLTWRVPLRWYLLVLVGFPALLLGAFWVAATLDGQPFRSALPGGWWLAPLFLPLVVLLGPLQEEVGWRGYALPLLLRRHGWVTAGVVLGLVWALWHRTPSTWAALTWSEPLAPTGPLALVLGAVLPDVALSVLMAWVYVRTGSALLAGLGLHTAANFVLFLPALEPSWAATITLPAVLGTLALGVVLVSRSAAPAAAGA